MTGEMKSAGAVAEKLSTAVGSAAPMQHEAQALHVEGLLEAW